MSDAVNLADFEALARKVLPKPAFDFFAGAAADEITARENRRAFDELDLYFRVLAGVEKRDLSVTLFGDWMSLPILIAPMGFHKLAHPEGEIATTQAAAQAGVIHVVSTMANFRLEEIRASAPGPLWFQLYVYKDRGVTRSLVERAEAAGYSAIQVTVDLPVLGRRGAADATAGVDARPEQKAEVPRLRRTGKPRCIHQRSRADMVTPAQRDKTLGDEGAIEAGKRHDVGDGAERDEMQ